MNVIGITSRLIEQKEYSEIREALDVKWGELLSNINCLPIAFPIEVDFNNYFKVLDIKGIILTGGNDLNLVSKNKLSIKRDVFEKKLIDYAVSNGVPLLGVCRGMQIITDYFGGTLTPIDGQVAIRHKLEVNPASQFYEELAAINDVNSFHN